MTGLPASMILTLAAGEYRIQLDPDTGGSIAAFTWRGIPLLQPVQDLRLAAQHGASPCGYPLFPYANRIGDANFHLNGESFTLARNFGDSPHSIHGNAWMRRWDVAGTAPDKASLVLRHTPPEDPVSEWPFAYQARQDFILSEDGLTVELSLRNLDRRSWPGGIGLHPYVSRTPQATLQFSAQTYWRTGADELPAAETPLTRALDFSQPRAIGAEEVDACFIGWGGETHVHWPEHDASLVISAAGALRFFQVYTPRGQNFCGLEPVSNMPDAIHWLNRTADCGLRWLAPGDSATGSVRFTACAGARA